MQQHLHIITYILQQIFMQVRILKRIQPFGAFSVLKRRCAPKRKAAAKAHPNKKAAAYARTRHRRGEHSRRREGVLPQAIAVACAVWLCHRRNTKTSTH